MLGMHGQFINSRLLVRLSDLPGSCSAPVPLYRAAAAEGEPKPGELSEPISHSLSDFLLDRRLLPPRRAPPALPLFSGGTAGAARKSGAMGVTLPSRHT